MRKPQSSVQNLVAAVKALLPRLTTSVWPFGEGRLNAIEDLP